MKKITFALFLALLPLLGFSQFTEGFEGATFPPTNPGNWITMDNGVGTTVSWTAINNPAIPPNPPIVNSGSRAAYNSTSNSA